MPIIKSAIKRMRQTAVRRARNMRTKRSMKVAFKLFSSDKSTEALSKTQSEIDKAVKKGILNKNTAARKKAQLAKQAKEAGVKVAASAKKAAAPKATAAKKAAPAKAEKAPAKKPAAKKAAPKKTAKTDK